jgi:alpha-glucosidase
VRAFNDGIAFRYEFPGQDNWHSYTLTDEKTAFRIVGDPKLLTLFLPHYNSSLLLSEVPPDSLMDMPALFQFPENTFMAITEAALVDYAGMYLVMEDGVLRAKLSPLPEQPALPAGKSSVKVEASLPHRTPWRVLMISDRIGALIESNILTNLNEPCKIQDVSWIKPGMTTFPWWNGSVVTDTSFVHGNNLGTNQYYIDFCARNGLEYHSVVEHGGHEWYQSDGQNYQPHGCH